VDDVVWWGSHDARLHPDVSLALPAFACLSLSPMSLMHADQATTGSLFSGRAIVHSGRTEKAHPREPAIKAQRKRASDNGLRGRSGAAIG
jgi:hypothetical protein